MFEVASSDLVNMGITVVSYTLKDIRDEEVSIIKKQTKLSGKLDESEAKKLAFFFITLDIHICHMVLF